MRKKRCKCCHELYDPLPHTYREQKTCSKPRCRMMRKRHAVKRWKRKHVKWVLSVPSKQKAWCEKNPGYWKQWRAKHPGYVVRNRRAQRRRNAWHRTVIAKGNA